jgi:hypothetical protein
MKWTVAGADPITALRCREASTQWEQIWQRTPQPDSPPPELALTSRATQQQLVTARHLQI